MQEFKDKEEKLMKDIDAFKQRPELIVQLGNLYNKTSENIKDETKLELKVKAYKTYQKAMDKF